MRVAESMHAYTRPTTAIDRSSSRGRTLCLYGNRGRQTVKDNLYTTGFYQRTDNDNTVVLESLDESMHTGSLLMYPYPESICGSASKCLGTVEEALCTHTAHGTAQGTRDNCLQRMCMSASCAVHERHQAKNTSLSVT
eukprot:m.516208 g.516208  ORF g.516208 m.516208 type:complete len:138 (-) comp21927_c3_seq12:1575-1988(-)